MLTACRGLVAPAGLRSVGKTIPCQSAAGESFVTSVRLYFEEIASGSERKTENLEEDRVVQLF